MKKEHDSDKAIALKYKKGHDRAPKVTAKGRGALAERILAIAHENNIPIKQDKTLLDALYRLEIQEDLPDEPAQG